MIVRPAVFDRHILTLDIAGFVQALAERCRERDVPRSYRAVEKPDHRDCRLLRARREGPRSRAAEQRDELAPFHLRGHSITSSARPRSESGTVRPRALAVLRLMISSTFVDCITGRSAGFSPLRTRPV